jgi:hypothetical protein
MRRLSTEVIGVARQMAASPRDIVRQRVLQGCIDRRCRMSDHCEEHERSAMGAALEPGG